MSGRSGTDLILFARTLLLAGAAGMTALGIWCILLPDYQLAALALLVAGLCGVSAFNLSRRRVRDGAAHARHEPPKLGLGWILFSTAVGVTFGSIAGGAFGSIALGSLGLVAGTFGARAPMPTGWWRRKPD